MARNKNLGSKLRRAKRMKQSQSIPNWVTIKTNRNMRSNPYSRRAWRNARLKRD
ncbi:MAG: 50S ribosomal protein L39e [Candidatus Hodarchaeota archaeon]